MNKKLVQLLLLLGLASLLFGAKELHFKSEEEMWSRGYIA